MPIPSQPLPAVYNNTGTAAPLPVPFLFYLNSEILAFRIESDGVTLTQLALGSDYNLSGAGNEAGGTLTPTGNGVVPVATKTLIWLGVPFTQPERAQPGESFNPNRFNRIVDKLVQRMSQLDEKFTRALKVPLSKTGTEQAFPVPIPNRVFGTDALGNFGWFPQISAIVGADSVNYLPSPAGSVSRTVAVRLEDMRSAKDFGAVGDDATNNDAAAIAIVNYVNTTGGFVYWPRGLYRFNSPIPAITAKSGGFIGAGPGMIYAFQNSGPAAGGVYGTVFRLNAATGDTITIDPVAEGVTIRDIGFWPVLFKTSGYEVHDKGLDTLVENIHAAYCYGVILAGGGSNGSTYRHIRAVGIWGEGGITCRGTGPSIENWAQGLTIDDFEYYNPLHATPTAAKHKGNWAISTGYAQHDTVIANGYIWQAGNAGTSLGSGSGPTISGLYSFAGAPTTTPFNDNGILWRMIGSATGANVLVDSNSVVVNIINSLLVGAGFWGIYFANTLGSGIVPQSIKVANTLIDTTIGDCVFLNFGYEITLENVDCRWSISGRGLSGSATFTGNLHISGGQFWNNALDGILLPPMANSNVTINGARCVANGVKTANTYANILVGASTTKFKIIGCTLGSDPAGAGTPKDGINCGAGCLNYNVSGNVSLGNGTAGYTWASARNVTTEIFTGNVGTVTGFTADSEGSWTPVLTFATPGNLNVVYSHQAGRYIIKDGWCIAEFSIQTSTFTHTTAAGALRITGLPATHISVAGLIPSYGLQWSGITKASYTSVAANLQGATNIIDFWASGSGQNVSNVVAADCPTGGGVTLRGVVMFRI